MIYTVELNFSDPGRRDAWNAWYESYLQTLVTLPGLDTAQRFRAVCPGAPHWEYLALYSVASLDLYDSDEYRNIGGGGNASARFREHISRRRNVYAGIERMPEITAAGRVLLSEGDPSGFDLPDILCQPLEAATGRRQAGATEFDGEPIRRAIAVSDVSTLDRLDPAALDGIAIYAPITKRYGSA